MCTESLSCTQINYIVLLALLPSLATSYIINELEVSGNISGLHLQLVADQLLATEPASLLNL